MEEDIILLNDFIKGDFKRDKLENYKGSYKMGFFYYGDIKTAIENLINKYKEYEQCLEVTSQALNNIAYDQIPIAIEDLKLSSIPKSKVKEKINKLSVSDGLEDNLAIPYLQELLEE